MTAYGYTRGHRIEFNEMNQVWRYADTGEVFDHERPCILCRKMPTPEGHDACLGELPGVQNACCGHGVEDGYIHYERWPFWMTNKNRWPLAIWLVVSVPFLGFAALMAFYGLTCDCDYITGVRPFLLPWSLLFLLMLVGTYVALWIKKKQVETAVLLLEKKMEALQ